MAPMLTDAGALDRVVTLQIVPGSLPRFLETRAEGGPLLKCFEGSVTLLSPGRPHETSKHRLASLVLAVCLEMDIPLTELGSTTWSLPAGAGDTAYEPDESYFVPGEEDDPEPRVPDLAIEIVVSHPERKALLCGAALGIPELWVLDVPRQRLMFYHLFAQGYQARARSKALPFLDSDEVLARLKDPATHNTTFHRNCREWARQTLAPRREVEGGES